GGGGLRFLNDKDAALKQGLEQIKAKNQVTDCLLALDKNGDCWMFGMGKMGQVFLSKTNARTGNSQDWKLPFFMYNQSNFAFDEEGKVWLPLDRQLIRFDPATGKWTAFDYSHLVPEGSTVFSIAKTPDGSWWLGTENGLVQAKPNAIQQFDFQLFTPSALNRSGLNCSHISSLLADPADPNLLWLGTKGGGLNRLDLRTGKFSHFTSKNGLPDDVVYGILADEERRLWLSTNRGLVCFNPATGSMRNYRQADGLQDDEFNTWAFGNSDSYRKNGELMFGGVKGLNMFDPKTISDNPHKPGVLITGLKINNLPVEARDSSGILKQAIEFTERIVLPYSRNNVTLEFAALEFTAPSKNRYRYHLQGAEKAGAHESNDPQAVYLNLQPGTYTFIVYGSNNDGVWSDAPARLQIKILPPWYRHWLAYLAYLLALGGLVFWYVRLRENRLKLQRQLALEQKQAEHDQEMNRLKLEEFAQRLLEKSHLLESLQERVQAEKEVGDAQSNQSADVTNLYKSNLFTHDEWENFRELFERVHPGFMAQIAHRLPQLSPAEIRLVLLTKMGLKTTDAAAMLGISPESVKKTRHRLRKKLYLQDQALEDLLGSF
ncbi:MAG: triple tyrosine motif-containing protein, partial [Bacteroidota bacterium]